MRIRWAATPNALVSWAVAALNSSAAAMAIAGLWAKMESDVKSERTKAGMICARAQGKAIGRPETRAFVDLPLVTKLRVAGANWTAIQHAHPRTVPTKGGGRKRPSIRTIQRAHQESAESAKGSGVLPALAPTC